MALPAKVMVGEICQLIIGSRDGTCTRNWKLEQVGQLLPIRPDQQLTDWLAGSSLSLFLSALLGTVAATSHQSFGNQVVEAASEKWGDKHDDIDDFYEHQ